MKLGWDRTEGATPGISAGTWGSRTGQCEAEVLLGGRGQMAEQIHGGWSSFRSPVGREEGVTTGMGTVCPQGSAPALPGDTFHTDALPVGTGGDQPKQGGGSWVGAMDVTCSLGNEAP